MSLGKEFCADPHQQQKHKQYPQKLWTPLLIYLARAYVKLEQEEIGIETSQRAYCLSERSICRP